MIFVRSTLYFLFLAISVLLFGVASIAVAPLLGFSQRSRIGNGWALSNLWALRYICRLNYSVTGLAHLPTSNCIIMANHQSTWETIALRGILPPAQAWVLKQELLRVPVFGWALRVFEPIAIDRNAGRKAVTQVVAEGIAALRRGRYVVIFPEGTRVAPGERKQHGMGGALLAERSGYPVLPIAHNAGLFWRRRGFLKYPGVVQVTIGPLVTSNDKKAGQIAQEVAGWLDAEVSRLVEGKWQELGRGRLESQKGGS
jgi:1-acyl-sn-glycerol-3-phosphate acyltransferase